MKYPNINILDAKNRSELRSWLQNNHKTELECWVEVKIGNPIDESCLWYLDAVEECLCFGWIDSTKKKVENRLLQRLSPRKKNSHWSELNKARYLRLERLNLTTELGRSSFSSSGKFYINEEISKIIDSDSDLNEKFHSFPILYQKIRIDCIQREIKNPERYYKMLEKFINMTKQQKMYGNWNDYGRLI